MQTRITADEMEAAARQLSRSERGQAVMRRLADLLKEDDLDLDLLDQRAFLALLGGVWTHRASDVGRIIEAALATVNRTRKS
jgi:hypothetical protein